MGNHIRTTILLALMTGLIIWFGGAFGGSQGMVLAFVIAAGMNFFSYWYSDKLVLKMYRASEVNARQAPELYNMVAILARNASLPMPKVYIIPQDTPNAFATGRNPEHAVVAVTQGLLNRMSRDEITGVLAHELAHVNNRDILIGSIAATMAGAIMLLANFARFAAIFGGGQRDGDRGGGLGLLLMAIVAPLAAVVIQMAISRSREYQADAIGARFAGSSEGLASALEKLGAFSRRLPMQANPSTAHMFIVNPLSGGGFRSLFSTHPPIEERIARLRGARPPKPPGAGPSQDEAVDAMQKGRSYWDALS